MFVHLGKEVMIPRAEIIMILDYQVKLEVSEGDGFIHHLAEKGKEKSCVITSREIFISPISSSTLKRRAETFPA